MASTLQTAKKLVGFRKKPPQGKVTQNASAALAGRSQPRDIVLTGDPMRDGTIGLLQEAIGIQRARAASYQRHQGIADSQSESASAVKLLGLAGQDLAHLSWLAERITQLGGTPDTQAQSAAGVPGARKDSVSDSKALMAAEASFGSEMLDSYGRILTQVGELDYTTRFLVEDILSDELDSAQDLRAQLAQ